MRLRTRASAVVVAAASAIALLAATMTAQPTEAVWEDVGGSALSVSAIATAPPPPDSPVLATDAQTVLLTATQIGTGPDMKGEPTPTYFCFSEEVRTTSVTDAAWSITLRTKLAPFNGVSKNNIWPYQTSYTITEAADYATSGNLIVKPSASNQWASTTKSHVFRFCTYTPEPVWQPPGPETYSVTGLSFAVTNGMPCVTAVTTGVKVYYVGFNVTFDYKALLDAERTAGRITASQYTDFLDNVYWQGSDAHGSTGSNYSVTLTGYDVMKRSVRKSIPVSLTSCSY